MAKPKLNSDQLPLFEPPTSWREPTSLPDPPRGGVVAIDTEDRDNGLSTGRGPGWVFRDGHLAGVSVAWRAGTEMQSIYVPLRHPDSANMDLEQTARWLTAVMDGADTIVFQNAPFDIGWLSTDGIEVPFEKIEDIHAMAVMLDENQLSYSLDAICRSVGVPGKDERLLREAAAAFGCDPKAELWKLPARHVGEYAEQDAVSTLMSWELMCERIDEEGLREAYQLEMDLIPMIMAMRRRGIRINESRAESTMEQLRKQRDEVLDQIARQLAWPSFTMDHANSPGHLERAFDQEQVGYLRTPKTKRGSFKSDWMKDNEHWLPSGVAQARALNDMSEKFIGTYILDAIHVGRVHAEVHQLRDDNGGTRSYRLSYSNPPLQQMPARDPILAPLVRSIFESERDTLWGSADYSQQEPRMAVHFAAICKLRGSAAAVEYYRDNPGADFHQMVSDLTGVPRKQAKIINLGLMYGMGMAKLAASLGVSIEEAKRIVEQYNARMPFVESLADFCTKRATKRGFIRLLDGARCRFDQWEPSWREADEEYHPPCSRARAEEVWPGRRLRRAFTHKAMNRLVQGSSARQTKLAMRECWRQGILPMIQMHDELGFPIGDAETGRRAAEIMRDIVQLSVPMSVDMQYGWHWGQASQEPPKGTEPATFDEVWENPDLTNADIYKMREAA
jgi:DNA polymerase I-like protein with 3'-5' exonuclease and polymerase domains